MLIGIVVKNAIVLVDYINLLRREESLDPVEAVTRADHRRLRPILMTTLTTVLGVFPLAFGIGAGAEIQTALLTLVFIPAPYLGATGLFARLCGLLSTTAVAPSAESA